jgi:ABC-type glycerol-3-phosphate transport system substrate-binding protein
MKIRNNDVKRFTLRITLVTLLLSIFVMTSCQKSCQSSRSDKITLRVWQTETDSAAIEQLQNTIKKFESENPEVKIELESVAWSALSTKLTTAIQAQNEPDVAHLEPFMVASLYSRDMLLPIDDVIEEIKTENNDEIYESVADLQLFNGKRYGLAYAVGTTGFAYRKDIAQQLNLQEPKIWNEYINFVEKIHSKDNKLKVLLPGGDPFFIDQLFAELVANNNGKLFDPVTNRPTLDSKEVIETLEFFKRLSPYVDQGWQTQKYLDQFNRFARGEAGNVPVTYARASKAIDSTLKESSDSTLKADPEHFAWMPQPVGPSNLRGSIATIDCEPYVIFKSSEKRKTTEYAKKFLKMYFKKENYLPFVSTIPIHLNPIFKKMAESEEYRSTDTVKRWKPWADQTNEFLLNKEKVRPILMPDYSEAGRQLPFLLEFQASKILTQAVTSVISGNVSPEQAAKTAQERSEQLITDLGFKRW